MSTVCKWRAFALPGEAWAEPSLGPPMLIGLRGSSVARGCTVHTPLNQRRGSRKMASKAFAILPQIASGGNVFQGDTSET